MKTSLRYGFIIAILYTSLAHSQDNTTQVAAIIKTMPTTVLDIDNTFTFGVEVPLNNRWSIQQDIGWGNSHTAYWRGQREQYPDKTNWRFRTQLRCYSNRPNFIDGRAYIGIEYVRKYVFINELKNIGRDCTRTFTCAYFEDFNIKTRSALSAFHLKFGGQIEVSDRLILDIFTGFGIKEVVVTNNMPPNSTLNSPPTGFFWLAQSFNPSITNAGSLSLGFSVGYQINKRNR